MKRALVLLGFIAAIAIVAWWLGVFSSKPLPGNASTAAAPAKTTVQAAKKNATAEPPPVDAPSHLADALNSPTGDIRSDLRIVAEVVEAFRSNFPRDGNPVGDNAEITAALVGKNKLGLQLISPKHPAINRNGELCDRWGTPFFFHAESGTKMEIRSAGPDRKMWSDDDVVYTP